MKSEIKKRWAVIWASLISTLVLLSGAVAETSSLSPTLTIKDIEFVLIPAGEFEMGSTREEASAAFEDAKLRSSTLPREAFTAEVPKHVVYLDAYYISKYEITNAQYRAFIEATRQQPPYDAMERFLIWDKPEFSHSEQPVVGVNYFDALAFCNWIGGQLPTEAQWEKAARGTDRRKYPWGNSTPNRRIAAHGRNIPYPAKVGSYPKDASPYGVMDMAGNVSEWCRDKYSSTFYRSSPPTNPVCMTRGDDQSIRGGTFNYSSVYLRSALRMRLSGRVSFHGIGFRAVYVPSG